MPLRWKFFKSPHHSWIINPSGEVIIILGLEPRAPDDIGYAAIAPYNPLRTTSNITG